MIYGDMTLLFGLMMAAGLVLLAVNFLRSQEIADAVVSTTPAPEPAE